VRCPRCSGVEDRVMDSRTAEEGAAIRRRRECLACGRRFTTYERLEEVPFVVVKRSGHREPFERAKVVAGLKAAGKNRPLSLPLLEQIAAEVEETLRLEGSEVTSQQVAWPCWTHCGGATTSPISASPACTKALLTQATFSARQAC